ncbi:MAG: hypothetical protein HYS18_13995 [Burkholderiales bacterium]|nr:hypothetical protein [Burkholderiales bacterium]
MKIPNLEDLDGTLLDGLDFCRAAYALFESVRSTPEGIERLRLRSGLTEKRLLEELLPICRYVQTYYRPGRYISVRWINGSQSYDAELHQRGEYISQGYYEPLTYLEATCAMHENEHWIWKLLNQGRPAYAPEGIHKEKRKSVESEPVVFSNFEHVSSFTPFVVAQIQKKAAIAYPESTSLVVQCHLNSLYTPDEWRQLIVDVESKLSTIPFREVLLYDGTTERATALVFPK